MAKMAEDYYIQRPESLSHCNGLDWDLNDVVQLLLEFNYVEVLYIENVRAKANRRS